MATSLRQVLFISLLLQSIIFIKVRSDDDDEEKSLFQGINSYRATLNLTHLTESENAKCLAEEIADEFKDQLCTNTTGPNTIPGTEPNFHNYPDSLKKCKLNVSTTRDGAILPACVHHLDASLVLSNYTFSSYSANLNDTRFTGMGIGSEKDWIVVVLTTGTPEGNFASDESDDTSSATLVLKKMENQDAVIRYNFDKQKDPKTGMWYATCKWCGKKCSMGVSGGYGMAMKHMKSCDKAKGSGGAGSSD